MTADGPFRTAPPCAECERRAHQDTRRAERRARWAGVWAQRHARLLQLALLAAISGAAWGLVVFVSAVRAGTLPIQLHEACEAECLGQNREFHTVLDDRCFCSAGAGRVIEVVPFP